MENIITGGWAYLIEDLLVSITDKLVSQADYVRFSAVCKPWLSVAKDQKLRRAKLYGDKQQLPMLLIPTALGKRSLYSLTDGKINDQFQLQMPYNMKRCCGSSHGWLAIVEENLSITLINPFTGKTIGLPPFMDVPDYEFECEYQIQKVVLSANPSIYPEDYVVVAICGEYSNLIVIKSGEKCWTQVESKAQPFCDVINYKNQLYALDHYGRVLRINKSKARAWALIVHPPRYSVPNWHLRVPVYATRTYTCESSDGGLFLAKRHLVKINNDESMLQQVTQKFEVFKLAQVEDGAKEEWVEVKSMDDDSLFVGDNYSISVSASNHSNFLPNCIYFTDDFTDHFPYEPFGPCDMGVFHLEDGSISKHYTLDPNNIKVPPPVWILPTLKGNLGT